MSNIAYIAVNIQLISFECQKELKLWLPLTYSSAFKSANKLGHKIFIIIIKSFNDP